MGVLHEVLVAIGVALTVLIACSVEVVGREYVRTGHVSLAVFDALHWAAESPPCEVRDFEER